jgi:hypothetical protein
MVQQADTEMTVMKKEIFIPSYLETVGIACHTGVGGNYMGEYQSQSEGGRNQGKDGQKHLLWFSWEGKARCLGVIRLKID